MADGVGHDAVNSYGGQQHRQRRETNESAGVEALRGHFFGQHFIHGLYAIQRKVFVQVLDLRAHGRNQAQRVERSAQNERHLEARPLQRRGDGFRFGLAGQAFLLHVADHAHDRPGLRPAAPMGTRTQARFETFSDGIFVRQEPADKRLIHHHGIRRVQAVALVEQAPFDQRNPQRREKSGRDRVHARGRHFGKVHLTFGLALDMNAGNHRIAAQRHRRSGAGRRHARQGLQPLDELVKECALPVKILVLIERQSELGGQYAVAIETGLHGGEIAETFDQQAGADE